MVGRLLNINHNPGVMKKYIVISALIFCGYLASAQSGCTCLPEGITFSTQSQIDSFPINYTGCNKILGDVVIEGDGIKSLNGLSALTCIGSDLRIRNNDSLISLSGLDNVTSIGGNVLIGDSWFGGNKSLTNLTGLDGLTSIGGNLEIYWNNALTSLTGLEGLTSIGGDLWIVDNDSLSTCEAEGICSYLSSPSGTVRIYNNV